MSLLTIYFPLSLHAPALAKSSRFDPCLGWLFARRRLSQTFIKLGIIPPLFLPSENSRNEVAVWGHNIMFHSQVTMLPLTRTRHQASPSTGASRLSILTNPTLPTRTSLTPSSRVTTIGNSPSRETRRLLWCWGSLLTLREEIHYLTWQSLLRWVNIINTILSAR